MRFPVSKTCMAETSELKGGVDHRTLPAWFVIVRPLVVSDNLSEFDMGALRFADQIVVLEAVWTMEK